MDKLQELKKKYKELGEEIERLENQGKVWEPTVGEQYHFMYRDGSIGKEQRCDDAVYKGEYAMGNCFKTREEAKTVSEKIKIYAQLKRLAEEINTEPIDWQNPHQKKYSIFCVEKDLNTYVNYEQRNMCVIYSTNEDFFKIAKERIGEDRLLKLFKE